MSILGKLLKDTIQPVLGPLGFVKKGNVFNRHYKDSIQVIDFQANRKRGGTVADVTINIGVFLPEVWRLCWGKPVPPFVKEHECFPRFRIGFLVSGFDKRCLDKWWKLTEDDAEDAKDAILTVVKDSCLPFLDSHGSQSAILDFTNSKANLLMPIDLIQASILRWLNNDKSSALLVLEELAKDEHWGKRALEVMQRLERQ